MRLILALIALAIAVLLVWRGKPQGTAGAGADNARSMAALLVVGVGRIDGDLSEQQRQAIVNEFAMTFSLDEPDAERLLVSSSYMLGDGTVLRDDFDTVLQRSREAFTGEQIDSLFEMMNRVALISGTPTEAQVKYIATVRHSLTA